MTRAAVSFVTLLLACSIWAENAPETDFRKATWGMTQAQVMATEPGHPADVRQDHGEAVVRYDTPPDG